jgi:hypothetical protein
LASILDQEDNILLRENIVDVIKPGRYEYLMKACALMVNKELIFSGVIELSRFMAALNYLGSPISSEEIWNLASKSHCGSIEEEDGEK